jgi:hypothetical protein
VDLIPPNSCCEAADVNCTEAKAVISFLRMSDRKELCQVRAGEHSSGSYPQCPQELNDLGVIGIGLNGINLKDNWADIRVDGLQE